MIEQFDETKLIETAREMIYTHRMDLASRAEATVQMLRSGNGRRYRLSVVIELLDDGVKSGTEVDRDGELKS